MRKIFLLYEYFGNDSLIVAAGNDLGNVLPALFTGKKHGPQQLIELKYDEVDPTDIKQRTVAIEGGCLHKCVELLEEDFKRRQQGPPRPVIRTRASRPSALDRSDTQATHEGGVEKT